MLFGLKLDTEHNTFNKAKEFFNRNKFLFEGSDPVNIYMDRKIYFLGKDTVIFYIKDRISFIVYFLAFLLTIGVIFSSEVTILITGGLLIIYALYYIGVFYLLSYYLALRKTGYKGKIKVLGSEKVAVLLIKEYFGSD